MPTLVLGKFLHGVTVTIVHISVQKMTVETVPKHVTGAYAPMTNFFMATGYMLILGSGLGLPDADYHPVGPDVEKTGANLEAYNLDKADIFWRFIYIFPVFLNILMLLGYFCYIKSDSILHSIRKGDDEQALALIEKVYDSSENPHDILAKLKTEIS